MSGLALRIGGDTTALDKAMSRANDIVAHQGKQMVSTMASVGTAMDKSLALKSLKYATQNSTALTASLRNVALAAGAIGLGIGIIVAMGAAIKAAAEETERLAKIGDSARSAGVSNSFFQVLTQQAERLGIEAEAVTRTLEKLKAASVVTQGEGDTSGTVRSESALAARLRQQVGAGNVSQAGLTAFLGAGDNEQRMKVLLGLMDEMARKGKMIAALDIGSKFLDPSIVDGIRRGTIEIDVLRKKLEDVSAKELRIFSDPDIQNAREMTRRLDEAGRIIANELKPAYDDLSRAGRDLYASTVSWAEGLGKAVGFLAQAYAHLKNIGNQMAGMDTRPGAIVGAQVGKILAGNVPATETGSFADQARQALAGKMNPTAVADAKVRSRQLTDGFFADKTAPINTAGPKKAAASSDEDRTTQLDRFTASLERARDVAKAELDTIGLGNVAREKAVAIVKAQAAAQADVKAGLRDSATLTEAERAKIEAAAAAVAKWKDEAEQLRDTLEFSKGLAGDALKGFVSDLREGKSAADALRNALDRISTKILDKLIDAAISGAFGGTSGTNMFAGLGKVFGFADGGYTGPGGKNQPKGVVHGGEVVWSKRDVARAGGVGTVEAMRKGMAGYASGGPVGMSVPSIPRGLRGGGGMKVVIQNTQADTVQATPQQQSNGDMSILISAIEARIADNVIRGKGSLSPALAARQTNRQLRG